MNYYNINVDKVVIGKRTDVGFLIAFILLAGLGLVTLYSVSGNAAMRLFDDELYFVKRQLKFFIIAALLVVVLAVINLDSIRSVLPAIVIATLLLCVLTCIPGIGIEKNGARRWIGFGGFEVQPSEPAKMVIILYLANLFAKKHDRMDELTISVIPAVIMTSIFVLFIYLQNDFSTAVVILLISMILFFFAGVKKRWFFALFCFIVPVIFLFIFTEPYRVRRIITFLNPNIDPFGGSYQSNLARRAITAGGFWGRGMGSSASGATSIPEVQSDFIFAGWVEEMGFFGVLLYFAILAYFSLRGFKIALECEDRFRSFVAFGAVSAILFQSLMNCGVVCGFFPSTGIPLPFFSSGGTSLIVSMCLCGLIINVSRWNSREGVIR